MSFRNFIFRLKVELFKMQQAQPQAVKSYPPTADRFLTSYLVLYPGVFGFDSIDL